MKIRFETEGRYAITDCPYGYINGYEGTTKKVGSYACSDCINFVSQDNEKKEVECKFDDRLKGIEP